MRSSSNSERFHFSEMMRSKKAQFMIITAVVIVSIFYLVSKWMDPYTIPDTSKIVLSDGPFILDNAKQEALILVEGSKTCDELETNLREYKAYVEDYAFKKLILYFDYSIETPCYEYDPEFPILVIFDLRIETQNTKYKSRFYGFWPQETSPI